MPREPRREASVVRHLSGRTTVLRPPCSFLLSLSYTFTMELELDQEAIVGSESLNYPGSDLAVVSPPSASSPPTLRGASDERYSRCPQIAAE